MTTQHPSSMFVGADPPGRQGIKPILNQDIQSMYKCAMNDIWFADEISLVDDVGQWNDPGRIAEPIKFWIKRIMGFFHLADTLVSANLTTNFIDEIPILEAQFFYRFQAFMEDIHSDTYSTIIESLIKDTDERDEIFNAVETMPVIRRKADWMKRYMDRENASLPTRLLAFVAAEGIFFASSFCALFYIRQLNILPGVCHSNDFISRDEWLHCRFGTVMYNRLKPEYRVSTEEIHAMFREVVEIETAFAVDAVPCAMLGVNSASMARYIEFIADVWLVNLGYPKLFNATNPFDFMNTLGIEDKTNFFEKRMTAYSKAGVDTLVNASSSGGLSLDGEF
jgi:ribonucleotide reductase beta subunit family protein with ferritin-like domain